MDANVDQIIAAGQLAVENMGQAYNALGMYLTVTSGYLLVAYFIGKDLTRVQVFTITALFVFFTSVNTIGVMSHFEAAVYFGHTYGAGRAPTWVAETLGPLLAVGILGALKFMWDVRHPRTE